MATISLTTVFITGANRGIGKGLVEAYLARPAHVVIAAVRDLNTAVPLGQIPTAQGSQLIIVKLDATIESDAADAVKKLYTYHNINHLDIVIANAGVCYVWPTVASLQVDDMLETFKPNVFGIIYLYQATRHLLSTAANPKWITIGSTAGSIGLLKQSILNRRDSPYPSAAYGPSKAAAHWITKRINAEEEKITSFVLHPGWVATDMGNASRSNFGLGQAPVSIEESVDGMLHVIDKSSKDTYGGFFWGYDDQQIAW